MSILEVNHVQKIYSTRFGGHKAPKYISWSHENRSQLVRIPAAVGEYRRAELRSPDPAANPYLAFALMILAGLVVLGGLKRIALVAEKIVPFMVILYIIGSIVILVTNFSQIGTVFSAIFRGAFAMQAAGGGVVGYGVKLAIEQGMKRGVFSNEAGLGSAAIAHAAADTKGPVNQGLYGIFEVFVDTIVICSLTALAIICSGVQIEFGTKPGSELIAEVRKTSRTPVIVLSAKTDLSDKVELLGLGADDYLTKPYQLEELWARILVQLRHASAAPVGELLRYKDWVLNPEEMTLTAAGQPVNLTAHEFKIVELLAGRPKRVFTKQQIYEAVWQEAYAVEDKTITVHISNIRAKLRPSGTDSYIQTVWGIGFKLSEG